MTLWMYARGLCLSGILCMAPSMEARTPPRSNALQDLPSYEPESRAQVPTPTLITSPLRVYSHPAVVNAVSFSRDGSLLAAGDGDGKVWLWPLGSEELVQTLKAHQKGLRSLAFSPDGTVLATGGGDGWVRIWDLKTHKAQAWLDARHRGPVTALTFSSRGGEIFSGSADDSIWMRDVITGKKVTTYFGHSAAVTSLVVAPDVECVLSGGDDRSVQGWSMRSGEQVDFSTQSSRVFALALSPAGLLATGTANGDISLRRTDGCTVQTVALRFSRHTGAVRALTFSPDGRWLYSAGDDRTIVRWDVERGIPVEEFEGHQEAVLALTVSPDGALLASSSRDHTVRIWKQGETTAFNRRSHPSSARTASSPTPAP